MNFGYFLEDVIHVLRECPAARNVWEQLIPRSDWLLDNLDLNKKGKQRVALFASALLRIWTARCKYILEPDQPLMEVISFTKNIRLTAAELCAAGKMTIRKKDGSGQVSWKSMSEGTIKINTDGP